MQPSPTPSQDTLEHEYADDINRARTRLQKLREVLNDLHQIGAI